MGTEEFLIDTNVAIDYISESMPENGLLFLDKVFDEHFNFSIINKIDLLAFPNLTEEEEQKFKVHINTSFIIRLEEEIVNKTVFIERNYKLKLPDAIIASTDLANNLTRISGNIKDFEKVDNLKVIDSHKIT